MLKKLILSGIIFAASSSSYAGAFYVGPGLQYEAISTQFTSYQAISPRLTFGYGTPLNDVYCLAGEFFAVAGTVHNHPTSSGLKNTPNAGFSLLPGFLFGQHSFGYGRLGLITADFSAQNTHAWGAQAGLGIETAMTPHWDIRGEYVYTAYENVSEMGSPKSSAFVMGLMYQF